MERANIIVEVTDFKSGPKYARSFGGKFDAATKLWTISISHRKVQLGFGEDTRSHKSLIDGTFGNGLRVISCDRIIGEWLAG